MLDQNDFQWASTTLSGLDPVNRRNLDNMAHEVKARLDDLLQDEVRNPRTIRRGGFSSSWRMAGAAAVALALGFAGLGVVIPDPAWAVDEQEDGLVRIELSTVLGRGPGLAGITEELSELGVAVEVRKEETRWPWESGRIVSIGWDTGGVVPEAFSGGRIDLDADLSDVGIIEHGDSGFVLDTTVFSGTVYVNVGDVNW